MNPTEPVEIAALRIEAEAGDSAAQFELGWAYYVGEVVAKDLVESFKWQRKAAEQGIAHAQRHVGYAYLYDYGVFPKNIEIGVQWLQKAAGQNDTAAQVSLGLMFYDGINVPRNYSEALKLFRKAAEHGSSSAQLALGRAYKEGNGVLQDDAEAVRWFREASESDQFDHLPYFHLGVAHAEGNGVIKDPVEAHAFFNVSSALGMANAKKRMVQLERKMTRDQIAEATKLAREKIKKIEAE